MIAGVLDNTPENMQRWLSNPSQVKPGTAMPNLSLTPDEVSKLTALLETFK
jgi:cytochrome c oxidase subunit 2